MEKKRNKQREKTYPVAMTIAGSDSGGGAGIQADLRTFNAFGVFGCSAITAVTSQNPGAVTRIDPIPPEGVSAQIEAVSSAINVTFAKTGMLFDAAVIEAVSDMIEKYHIPLVCDPVMISTSGRELLAADAVDSLKKHIIPRAAWITPNVPEAELLCNRQITSAADQSAIALELYKTFGVSVWLKGGHMINASGKSPARATDIICRNGELWQLSSIKVDVPSNVAHGTGCTLSAALTAALALEMPWKEAVCESRAFVMGSLVENIRISSKYGAMYPPGNDYMNSVQLVKLDQ